RSANAPRSRSASGLWAWSAALVSALGRDIWMPQSGSLCPMGGLRLRRSARRAERAAGGLAAPQALVRLGGSSRWCRMGDRVARAVGGKGRLIFYTQEVVMVVDRSGIHRAHKLDTTLEHYHSKLRFH